MHIFVWILNLFYVIQVSANIYVEDGYPYENKSITISTRLISPPISPINPSPMHNKVFYPDDDSLAGETFGVYYFVTGFFGLTPPLIYDDYLAAVATHGYVVVATWPVLGDDGATVNFTAESHFDNIDYLVDNLPPRIRQVADFSHLALGCHSAGCASTLRMAAMDTDMFMASANMEPMTFAIREGADFTMPGLLLGAELANNSCSRVNWDFERFYDEWNCPRVKIEVGNVGHCGILTDQGWEACGSMCVQEDPSYLEAYRLYLHGLTAAFLNHHVQGNPDMLQYVTDTAHLPDGVHLLQHQTDLQCDETRM